MIRYHGGPCTPIDAALELWSRRNALISFFYPQQVAIAARMASSFILDNGAFSAWEQGVTVDWGEYVDWVSEWNHHPGYDWCLIPDKIDGDEKDNDALIDWWFSQSGENLVMAAGVPVWHLHESLDRLDNLVEKYPRVAIGSSGEFSEPGTLGWWGRMSDAMKVACDDQGRPYTKLHGLRQMDTTIFSHIPYSSVDSARIARKISVDISVPKAYRHLPPKARALVMAWDADMHISAARWTGSIATQKNLEMA